MKKKLLALLALVSSTGMAFWAPYEPNVAWTKRTIRTCFGGPEHQSLSLLDSVDRNVTRYTAKEKQIIKDFINKEFTQDSVGLNFSGWQDCNATASNGDLIVFKDEISLEGEGHIVMRGGAASVGERGSVIHRWDEDTRQTYPEMAKSSTKLLPLVILNTTVASQKKVSSEEYLQLTAIHEFGHVAGLRHEHVRMEDAKKDPNCKKATNIPLKTDPLYSSTHFSGDYDANSVMNYCYFNSLLDVTGTKFRAKVISDELVLTDPSIYSTKEVKTMFGQIRTEVSIRIGLSHLDKEAIRCLYKYEGETKKNLCSRKI